MDVSTPRHQHHASARRFSTASLLTYDRTVIPNAMRSAKDITGRRQTRRQRGTDYRVLVQYSVRYTDYCSRTVQYSSP